MLSIKSLLKVEGKIGDALESHVHQLKVRSLVMHMA